MTSASELTLGTVAALRAAAREAPVAIPIRGGSMRPALEDGDRVVVRPARLLLPGDVVVFRGPDDAFVVHRLLGLYRRDGSWRLLTRGDAVPTPDDGVPVSRLVGRADVPVSASDRARAAARFVARAARRLRPRGR